MKAPTAAASATATTAAPRIFSFDSREALSPSEVSADSLSGETNSHRPPSARWSVVSTAENVAALASDTMRLIAPHRSNRAPTARDSILRELAIRGRMALPSRLITPVLAAERAAITSPQQMNQHANLPRLPAILSRLARSAPDAGTPSNSSSGRANPQPVNTRNSTPRNTAEMPPASDTASKKAGGFSVR